MSIHVYSPSPDIFCCYVLPLTPATITHPPICSSSAARYRVLVHVIRPRVSIWIFLPCSIFPASISYCFSSPHSHIGTLHRIASSPPDRKNQSHTTPYIHLSYILHIQACTCTFRSNSPLVPIVSPSLWETVFPLYFLCIERTREKGMYTACIIVHHRFIRVDSLALHYCIVKTPVIRCMIS